jgi:TonB family protein
MKLLKSINLNLTGESFFTVFFLSFLFHTVLIFSIIFIAKAVYKSKDFERPNTFDLIKLSQIFEAPVQPSQAQLPKIKSVKNKLPKQVKQETIPEQEKNPIPTTEKTQTVQEPQETSYQPQTTQEEGISTSNETQQSVQSDNNIYEEGKVDELPVLIKSVKPFYPEIVQEQGISGTVKGWVIIDKDGTILQIKITNSPHEFLSEEVLKSVARWKYKPAKYKGFPVKMRKWFEIKFELQE